MRSDRIRKAEFIWFHIATTVVAFMLAAAWWMSPLALGFQEWPDDPLMLAIADMAFFISYFIGIPLLLAGQITAALLAIAGRMRAAYLVPTASIGLFIVSIATVLSLVGAAP